MIGFHGTDTRNYKNVKLHNFRHSQGDKEWLGTGAYFFVDGISNPKANARFWAIANSWNSKLKINEYETYAVISAKINVSAKNLLDLTTTEGIETFNHIRDQYIKAVAQKGLRFKNGEYKDGYIINMARDLLNIDVIKGNFYIKFKDERKGNISFRTPNCTIVSVFNLNCIELKSIKLELEGNINETI